MLSAQPETATSYIPPSSTLQYYVADAAGALKALPLNFAVNGSSPRLARTPHDFAATSHYTVWFDVPGARSTLMHAQ